MKLTVEDYRYRSRRRFGYYMPVPHKGVGEILVPKGLELEEDSHGRRYEAPCGGKYRFIESETGEWGCRMMYGQRREAQFHLERENWHIRDPGWDLECDQLHGKIDVKSVPYPENPCLMVRHYEPEEDHPPYRCDIFINMWVQMDGMVPVAVGAVGWMDRDDVIHNPDYPVRDEFNGKALKPRARCVQWWLQEPLSKLLMMDMAASPQLAMFD